LHLLHWFLLARLPQINIPSKQSSPFVQMIQP